MTYYYQIDTKNGTTEYEYEYEYEYEPTWADIKTAIKSILKHKTTDELFDICDDLANGKDDIETYFEDELHEIFEDNAIKEWETTKESQTDEEFDYWYNKF